MSDLAYYAIAALCRPIVFMCTRPILRFSHWHGQHPTACRGGYILACNHTSPFDVPLLMRHSRRPLDFVSITEVFRNPVIAALYRSMNAFPLDRSRPDPATVRTILDRLSRGRVIAMFPEGGFRRGDHQAIVSGKLRSGIGRLAINANVPVLPVFLQGSEQLLRPSAWLPTCQTKYDLSFGTFIEPTMGASGIEHEIVRQWRSLHHPPEVLVGSSSR